MATASESRASPRRSRLFRIPPALWIGVTLGFLGILATRLSVSDRLENHIFDDFMLRTATPSRWSHDIVLVLVDDVSLQSMSEKYGWRWPWPRDAYSALIAYLKKSGAKIIAFDILFPEESEDVLKDERFAAIIKAAGNVWLASLQGEKGARTLEPTSVLKEAAGNQIVLVNAITDSDGIIRRYPWKNLWNNSQQLPMAVQLVGKEHKKDSFDDDFLLKWHANSSQLTTGQVLSAGALVNERLPLLEQMRDTKGKLGGFDQPDAIHFARWIEKSPTPPNAALFKNKIVLIGVSGASTFDQKATPLAGYETGAMVQATALANLLQGDALKSSPTWLRNLLILLASLSVSLFCLYLRTISWQSLSTLLSLAGVLGISFLSFLSGFWIPPVMAILTGFASFTSVMTWNYFIEDRKKRELKQLFSDFVSPDVLYEIQNSANGINLQGDRRVGTAFFCDLVGFTSITEKASPEELMEAINAYLAESSRLLMARGAYVDKFIGDAVMAVFNIPRPQHDHAVQACLVTIELHDMMTDLNRRISLKYGINLSLRIGVNTGEMTAGCMGYARRLNYSVLGDAVNLASRLEGANKVYHTKTMIGPLTQKLAAHAVETRYLDRLQVKGKTEAVEVHEVMAVKGGLTESQSRFREIYLQGIQSFHARRWMEAINRFKTSLTLIPDDGPCKIYIERCHRLMQTPPGPDWNGAFALDSK